MKNPFPRPRVRLSLPLSLLAAAALAGGITLLALWCQPNSFRALLSGFLRQPLLIVLNALPVFLLVLAAAALLRIGGDCFTLSDINAAISGCGIKALAQEKDRFGYIRIIFPDVAGIPEGFEQIREIILDIIPCHLDVEFYFRYLTWAECEAYGYTWAIVHERAYTWFQFELAV